MNMTKRVGIIGIIALLGAVAIGAAPPNQAIVVAGVGPSKADGLKEKLTALLAESFALYGKFVPIDPGRSAMAIEATFTAADPFDPASPEKAMRLGRAFGAEAVATASLSAVDGTYALSLRIFDATTGRLVGTDSSVGNAEGLEDRARIGVGALCLAWAKREQATPAASPKAAASKAAPAAKPAPAPKPPRERHPIGPFALSFLAGYSTVATMNWEVEAALPKLPIFIGLEFAYERTDKLASLGDDIMFSAIGRYFPAAERPGRGFMASTGLGFTVDFSSGVLLGPLRASVGWSFILRSESGPLRIEQNLRIEPELGVTWTMRHRYWPWYRSFWFLGIAPYAGLKVGL
jgi:hypothetical protein